MFYSVARDRKLLFYPEDGSITFLRKAGNNVPLYTASRATRLYSITTAVATQNSTGHAVRYSAVESRARLSEHGPARSGCLLSD